MAQREREKEGDMFADKEKFVTGAFRRKMEEIAEQEKEQVLVAKMMKLMTIWTTMTTMTRMTRMTRMTTTRLKMTWMTLPMAGEDRGHGGGARRDQAGQHGRLLQVGRGRSTYTSSSSSS